jgi:hypothetical protein
MEQLIIPPEPETLPARVRDPATFGYPPGLPVEIALQEYAPQYVCESYGIDAKEWDRIRQDPVFISDLHARLIELKAEGASFKMKAQLQSLEYLKELWKISHNDKVDAEARAKIMLNVIKYAGYDASRDQAAAVQGAAIGQALQINIHLK